MNELTGFIGIGVLIIVQISYFAYAFGTLNSKVRSIDKRLNDLSHRFDRVEDRVGKLEGRK